MSDRSRASKRKLLYLPSIQAIDAELERRRLEKHHKLTQRQFAKERERQTGEGGLHAFVRYFWPVLEPMTDLVDGWPLEAICDHLEAVTRGEITKLLINVPPGFMKSLLVDVFWPAWEWGPMNMPHMRYVAFSYSPDITERDNGKFRDLISSPQYRELWGDRFDLIKLGEGKITNNRTGFKKASSIRGVGTGERGTRVILDDPHNVKDTESETVRQETVRWFRESMSNRLNDMRTSAIVIIMQRVHFEDVSGFILGQGFNYCHLMVPMEFDGSVIPLDYQGNDIGWIDPRALDEDGALLSPAELDERSGMLAWEERFPPDVVENMRFEIGPFAWAGQYSQNPVPRKGGIFDISWWQDWEEPKFPKMSFILASLDSAYTEKEENDPSGFTVWGVWTDPRAQQEDLRASLQRQRHMSPAEIEEALAPEMFMGQVPQVMLMAAWRKHLRLHGTVARRMRGESYDKWAIRTNKQWGLVEHVAHTCRRFDIDVLLIEAKANGLDVIHEMERLYRNERWQVIGVPAPRDKVARAYSVQPAFSQEIVWAPLRKDWSEMVKDEMATFPKGKYKDLTDSATHAMAWLRNHGLIQRPEEIAHQVRARSQQPKKPIVLYHA